VIKLIWMENEWMDWIEWMWMWMDVESGCGKWKVARFRISHLYSAGRLGVNTLCID